MKKQRNLAHSFFAGIALLAFGLGSASGQNILFFDNFSGYDEGTMPTHEGPRWLISSHAGPGSAGIVIDSGEVFPHGPDNRFLRVVSTNSLNLRTVDFTPTDVLTASFDFIGRVHDGDGDRWLNVNIRSGGSRAHITSPRMFQAHIRGDDFDTPYVNDVPLRWDTVMNNTDQEISYDSPLGGTVTLASGMASVWQYDYNTETWSHLIPEYLFARNLGTLGAVMDNVFFQLDTNAPLRSFDLDNVLVVDGAHIGAIPEPSTYALLFGLSVLAVSLMARRKSKSN